MKCLLVTVIALLALAGCKQDHMKNCEDTRSAQIGALVASEYFVKQQLKSPSTADFPNLRSDGVAVTKTGECTFKVVSYVDAQNGFGAQIRTRYVATMRADPEDGGWFGKIEAMN